VGKIKRSNQGTRVARQEKITQRYLPLKGFRRFLWVCLVIFGFFACCRVEPLRTRADAFLLTIGGYASHLWQSGQQLREASGRVFPGLGHLNERVRTLEAENRTLRKQLVTLAPVVGLYKSLSKKLNLKVPTSGGKFVTALVITAPFNCGDGMFLVSAGSHQGVQKGQVVVCPEGLVGRVDGVSPQTARIMPVTHPAFRVPVQASPSGLQGIVAGNGSPALWLRFQEENFSVPSGEVFLTSALGGTFPPGLVVAVQEETLKEGSLKGETDKKSHYILKSPVPWRQIDYVYILMDPVERRVTATTPSPPYLEKNPG